MTRRRQSAGTRPGAATLQHVPTARVVLSCHTVLPKRVLSLAGFWNLAPNDLLTVTPALVRAVEQRGGKVVRRDGVQVCFETHERALLIEAAIEAMTECLPTHRRRLEF